MVSPNRNFPQEVNFTISFINSALKKKVTGSSLKKIITKIDGVSGEQWERLYWLYKEDGNKEVADAIVAHALGGKAPAKEKPPLHVTFYWANQRIKKEVLASLPLGEGRNNFNDKLKETIGLIEKTYRSSGDRYLPKVSFGDYAIKLTDKENCRCLYKLFNDGEAAVIYHIWHGTSTDPNAKLVKRAKKASSEYPRFDPISMIEISPDGDWMFESIEVGEILNFIVLNEAKEKF